MGLNRQNRPPPPPPPPRRLETCSDLGEERAEFSPIRHKTSQKEANEKDFLSTYVQISSMCWTAGGSAVQPLQGPDGKALSQPKPHPLSKIV